MTRKINISSILRNQSLQIILLISLYVISANYLPDYIHNFLYTISLLIKDILILMMPITIAIFIASTISCYEKQAPLFIILIIFFEAISNFSSVWYAYATAHISLNILPSIEMFQVNNNFEPFWRIPIITPTWWTADKGSIFGLITGCYSALTTHKTIRYSLKKLKYYIEWILTKLFAKLIPFFVLGFVANMYKSNILANLTTNYLYLFLLLIIYIIFYLGILFILSSGFSITKYFLHIKNILPAGALALTSGCSMSTMPWTIKCAAKNLQNPEFASAVIPATTNIQQIGDCIANSFLCFIIYVHFFGHPPTFMMWLNFSIIFVAARYATAAMLGGAIFVMLPIYEHYLNFNNEMIALILAMNVVLDPIITSSNVVANGALCRVFEKFFNYIRLLSSLKKLNKSSIIHSGKSGKNINK